MEINIQKLHPLAQVPFFATDGAAGADMVATRIHYYDKWNKELIPNSKYEWENVTKVKYDLGIAFEIPEGYALFLFPRSSVMKQDLTMTNCVGVIDCDYRGEVSATFYVNENSTLYDVGERCCQVIVLPVPKVKYIVKDKLSKTIRGTGSYGHTGK